MASSFLLISLSLASSVGESISASSHFANSLFLPSWSMQLHIQTKHSWSSSLVFGKRAVNPMGLMSSMQSECCYPCSLRPLLVRSNYTPPGCLFLVSTRLWAVSWGGALLAGFSDVGDFMTVFRLHSSLHPITEQRYLLDSTRYFSSQCVVNLDLEGKVIPILPMTGKTMLVL